MFPSHHNSGFYCATVTKSLLGGLVLSSVAFNIPLQSYRHLFTYSSVALTINKQWSEIFKLLATRLVFLDPKDVFCAGLLLYHFRIFERRYGSYNYTNYLLGTFSFSLVLELGAMFIVNKLNLKFDPMPSGPYGIVFALLIPYYIDIPRVAVGNVMGIPVTGKSFHYIIALQMSSQSAESFLLSVIGLMSGLMYQSNFLHVKTWLKVPNFLSSLANKTFGPLLKSAPPPDPVQQLGASLEIQRQQQVERMEQQMMLSQIQQNQRQGNLQNFGGFPLFGANFNVNNAAGRQNREPSDDQIQQLVDMGFARDRVLAALRSTDNDVTTATNILLHDS